MLTEAINELLRPLRNRRADLADFADDPAYLNHVLGTGNQRARRTAEHTLAEVHHALGMTYVNL